MTVDHQRAGKVQNDLRSSEREVRDVRYGEAVTEIGLPDADVEAFRAWLADVTAVTAGFELGVEAYGDAQRPRLAGETVRNGRMAGLS